MNKLYFKTNWLGDNPWLVYCKGSRKRRRAVKQPQRKKRVDGSAAYELNEPTDSFVDATKSADPNNLPNLRQLLIIGCISSIGSTEAERAVSGVSRIKTPYRLTIGEDQESNLNFLQLQRAKDIDLNEVKDIFIDLHPRRSSP